MTPDIRGLYMLWRKCLTAHLLPSLLIYYTLHKLGERRSAEEKEGGTLLHTHHQRTTYPASQWFSTRTALLPKIRFCKFMEVIWDCQNEKVDANNI